MATQIRPAAVAGVFYPDSAHFLADEVQTLMEHAPTNGRSHQLTPKAIIAPHAGYIYSGPIAASVYQRLSILKDKIRRVVLLGPAHRVAIDGMALPSCDAFATPLGSVPLDKAGMEAIRDIPQVIVDDEAHRQEHSLEVQLPFLQTVLGEFSIVPLTVGHASPFEVAEVLERLWGGPETLIVVSSDLSHYLSYMDAKKIDRQTAEHITQCCPTVHMYQACGATAVNGLLLAARHHGLQVTQLDLRNSGDTAGDKSRVVGYGAFLFGTKAPEAGGHVH